MLATVIIDVTRGKCVFLSYWRHGQLVAFQLARTQDVIANIYLMIMMMTAMNDEGEGFDCLS